jgi:hypothetical protein
MGNKDGTILIGSGLLAAFLFTGRNVCDEQGSLNGVNGQDVRL